MALKLHRRSDRGRRSHRSYAAPLQQPQIQPSEINAQADDENQRAAKRLKLVLELDEQTEDVAQSVAHDRLPSHAFSVLYGTPTNYMNSMIAKAYRDSYRRHKVDDEDQWEGYEKPEEGSTEEGEEEEDSPAAAPSYTPKGKVRIVTSGQRRGLGVIGQPIWPVEEPGDCQESDDEDVVSKCGIKLVPSSPATLVIPTMLGCDIPMPFEGNPSLTPQTMSSLRAAAFPHKLDPDLPSLALEHPARIWNVVYHSLDAAKKPPVQWAFSTCPSSETTKNHDDVDYRAIMFVGDSGGNGIHPDVGYQGAWKRSKIEAMNSALVTAFDQGLLSTMSLILEG